MSRHPKLKARVEALLSLVDNEEGNLVKADEAEQRVIEEIRQMGQTTLQEWATQTQEVQTEHFTQEHPQAHRTHKKNLLVQLLRNHQSPRAGVYL